MDTYKVDNLDMTNKKIGRNDKCKCGSGLKYKKCCFADDNSYENKINTYVDITNDFTNFEEFAKHIETEYFNTDTTDSNTKYKTMLCKYINSIKIINGAIVFIKTHKNKYFFKYVPIAKLESGYLPDDLKTAVEYYKTNSQIKKLYFYVIQNGIGSREMFYAFREGL
jgi:hypothetical protein